MIPEALQVLERILSAQQTIAETVLMALGGQPASAAETSRAPAQAEAPSVEPVTVPKAAPPPRPKAVPRLGPKPSELDQRVVALLASRPGTSVAEIEREIGDVGRSRLEWSLRRLLANGQVVKNGNTCGARYSTSTDRSSLLREGA